MGEKGILFIGGCGFIGSNLVRRFMRGGGYKVVVFEAPGAPEMRISDIAGSLEIVHGNLSDKSLFESVFERFEISIVVHLVSSLLPNSTIEEYQKEIDNVIKPTIDIINLCANKHIRFVFFSSGGTIYGNSGRMERKEDDLIAPISYYGLSKCNLENVILIENRRMSLPYLILRPSNPYGHGQNLYGKQGLIAVAIGKVLEADTLELYGDAIRDYIYIEDLAEYVFLMISENVPDGIYNIGSGEGHSNTEIVSILEKVSGRKLNTSIKEKRNGDVNGVILDISKLRNVVNIEPTGLEDGLSRFWKEIIG